MMTEQSRDLAQLEANQKRDDERNGRRDQDRANWKDRRSKLITAAKNLECIRREMSAKPSPAQEKELAEFGRIVTGLEISLRDLAASLVDKT